MEGEWEDKESTESNVFVHDECCSTGEAEKARNGKDVFCCCDGDHKVHGWFGHFWDGGELKDEVESGQ